MLSARILEDSELRVEDSQARYVLTLTVIWTCEGYCSNQTPTFHRRRCAVYVNNCLFSLRPTHALTDRARAQ
jgi:hypothetical protein